MLLWQSGQVPNILLALSPALSHPAVCSSCNGYLSSEARPLQMKGQLAYQILALAISIHSNISRGSPMLSLEAELLSLKHLGAGKAPGIHKKIIFL